MNPSLDQLVASSCSAGQLDVDSILRRFAELGYRKFEVFTSWAKSHFDIHADPAVYLEKARPYGWTFTSLHLPPVGDDLSLTEAITGVKFARALGCKIVLFKATSRANYIKAGRPFLDAIEGLGITPVLQNHFGQAISSLEDFREVLEGINDRRMKTLFEVGQFHTAGVKWPEGYKLLKGSIALVHIKDQVGPQPVKFGEGEVDLKGLFRTLRDDGYRGDYVVEMEAAKGDTDKSVQWLGEARQYIGKLFEEISK